MTLGEVVVINVHYNFTKFHQNQMNNKKVSLIAHFSVQNFKVSVELWKSYIVYFVKQENTIGLMNFAPDDCFVKFTLMEFFDCVLKTFYNLPYFNPFLHGTLRALCTIFTILLTLWNSEQKNRLLIKLFCFSFDFDETWWNCSIHWIL